MKMENIEYKLRFLHKGDWIYLHPKDSVELAFLGNYKYNRIMDDKITAGMVLGKFVSFSMENYNGVKLWVPNSPYYVHEMIYPIPDIVIGKTNIYVGETEIKKGFEENDNFNWEIASRIMAGR